MVFAVDLTSCDAKSVDGVSVKDSVSLLCDGNQLDVHGQDTVSATGKVLAFGHPRSIILRMLRRQGYQFEAMPKGEQLRHLRSFAGSCRFVYNKALALNQQRYEAKEKRLGYAGLCTLLPQWKRAHPWLADTPSQALQQSLRDLERAYTNFFEQRADFPDFHKKGRKDSFRIPQGFEVDNQNGRIKLPKVGWMRYQKSRDIESEPKNVTVSLVAGKVYVSIQTEREVERVMHPSTSAVGVDWGVVHLATLSDGEVVDRCSPLWEHAKRLATLQRRLARKKKFSNNWRKWKAKISKLHQHIANVRKDFVHKASDRISKSHAVVVVEDLQVRSMSKSAKKNVKAKSGLNRAILDASPFELRRQLEYKALWRGGLFIAVPPQNTSLCCLNCGHVSAENRRTQARFVCVKCGFSANADFVAACNILEAGPALLACSHSSGAVSPSWQEPAEGIPA